MAIEEVFNEEEEQQENNTLLWAALGLSFGIDIFVSRINREIEVLRGAGLDDRTIVATLDNDLSTNGRIFGELRNNIKRAIVLGVMQGFRVGQDNIYGDNVRFRWVSVGSPRICPDCQERVGSVRTWDEWERLGVPASGFSVCKEYCYCQLVPESVQIDDSIVVEGIGAERTR
jgi:hypothetical protein|tara:strand:+ start:1095 stop:1613 length:519 start_codon:yes stop_codon:yes gene_type:complete